MFASLPRSFALTLQNNLFESRMRAGLLDRLFPIISITLCLICDLMLTVIFGHVLRGTGDLLLGSPICMSTLTGVSATGAIIGGGLARSVRAACGFGRSKVDTVTLFDNENFVKLLVNAFSSWVSGNKCCDIRNVGLNTSTDGFSVVETAEK